MHYVTYIRTAAVLTTTLLVLKYQNTWKYLGFVATCHNITDNSPRFPALLAPDAAVEEVVVDVELEAGFASDA